MYRGVDVGGGGWIFNDAEGRLATDAEVAAYHRAVCQKQTPEPVKAPPISNATHAGRRVRNSGTSYPAYKSGIVVTPYTAERIHQDYLCHKTVVVVYDDGSYTWSPSECWELL